MASLAAQVIAQHEGYRSSAYWDVNAYRVGYGSDTWTDTSGVQHAVTANTSGITKDMALADLDTRIGGFQNTIQNQIGADTWASLDANTQAGLTSVAYNYGSLPKSVVAAVGSGDKEAIASSVENLSANPDRRAQEADLIRGGDGEAAGAGGGAGGEGGAGGGLGGAAGAAGKAAGAARALTINKKPDGQAGCVGGGSSAPQALSAAGLAQGLGLAPNGLMGQLSNALGGGAIGGALSGALGQGAIGALGGIASGGLGGALSGALGGIGGSLSGSLGGLLGASGLGGIPGLGGALQGALGGLMSGNLNNVLSGALGGAMNGLGQAAGANLASALSSSGFSALSGIGADILPSLTGVLPGALTTLANQVLGSVLKGSPQAYGGGAQMFAANGGLTGVIQQVANNQMGGGATSSTGGGATITTVDGGQTSLPQNRVVVDPATGTVTVAPPQLNTTAFINNFTQANAVAGVANQVVGTVAESLGQTYGSGDGGLGATVRNMSDVVTLGATALGTNLGAVSTDLVNLGKWDVSNLQRFMQPGNVAYQILESGVGNSILLTRKLTSAGVPLLNVASPVWDQAVFKVLSSITDRNALGLVSSTFNMSTPFKNLGDLCSLKVMMPNSTETLPVDNFKDLGELLIAIGMTNVTTAADLGSKLALLEPTDDLNNLSQMSSVQHEPSGQLLLDTFGYGSGSIGEITMADIMGTAAGYVHTDTLPVLAEHHAWLDQHPATQDLRDHIQLLQKVLNNEFYDEGHDAVTPDPDTGAGGADAIPPSQDLTSTVVGQKFDTMDAAVGAVITIIETDLQTLKDSDDPEIQDALDKMETAHNASCAQILREAHLTKTFNIDLFSEVEESALDSWMFADSLTSLGKETGHGQAAHFLERIASDDIYGDAIKASMRFGRNMEVMDSLGVNTEKFLLPASMYYRNPLEFYKTLYLGEMPAIPTYVQDQYLPQKPGDIYVDQREQKLAQSGYDTLNLLPAQRDEIYMDLQWDNVNDTVLKRMGESVVKAAIDRNVRLTGTSLNLTTLNGTLMQIAEIKPAGLVMLDNDSFIKAMMDIVNRLLYGNIGATKYTNPLDTDSMIYGVLEMLAQLNPSNIDALMNTVLGTMVADSLLASIASVFGVASSASDTGFTRNKPNAWGTVGGEDLPISDPMLPIP